MPAFSISWRDCLWWVSDTFRSVFPAFSLVGAGRAGRSSHPLRSHPSFVASGAFQPLVAFVPLQSGHSSVAWNQNKDIEKQLSFLRPFRPGCPPPNRTFMVLRTQTHSHQISRCNEDFLAFSQICRCMLILMLAPGLTFVTLITNETFVASSSFVSSLS